MHNEIYLLLVRLEMVGHAFQLLLQLVTTFYELSNAICFDAQDMHEALLAIPTKRS